MSKAATIRVDLSGQQDIINALKRAGSRADAVMEDAVEAGAEIIREEASSQASKTSGQLSEHIEVAVERQGADITASVGPDRDRFWGLFVEFGADEHEISPKNAAALKFEGVYRAHATHPGVPAQPFLRPAFDEKSDEAEEAIIEALREALGLD